LRLVFQDIGAVAAQLAALAGVGDILLVDQPAAGGVEDDRPFFIFAMRSLLMKWRFSSFKFMCSE